MTSKMVSVPDYMKQVIYCKKMMERKINYLKPLTLKEIGTGQFLYQLVCHLIILHL